MVRSLARHGPRRFYILNTGISTLKPLSQVVAILRLEGLDVRYFSYAGEEVERVKKQLETQQEGSHADELETSLMLAIDPSRVDMKKAAVEYGPGKVKGPLSPDPASPGASPSGIYGDATLATAQKGKKFLEGCVKVMLAQIEELRRAAPPERGPQ